MNFDPPLIKGRLLKRYKRFLADAVLEDGQLITAHCANPGSMMGLAHQGATIWLSPNTNPKAKLPYRWEMVEIDGTLVGINTAHPNRIVEEAILAGRVREVAGYAQCRREVKYGENSRIDLLLQGPDEPMRAEFCYVEVKNVTLKRGQTAQFPDAVTARGTKHLRELGQMVEDGHRAVMLFLVQRADCDYLTLAHDIDPVYCAAMHEARDQGVEVYAYSCTLTPQSVDLDTALAFQF